MTIIIEIDKRYCGIGIDNFENVKGIRLGYLAIHLIFADFDSILKGLTRHEKRIL
ncbi:MAG: hypothetical protein KKH94_11505 [Candidatus Omnitrophica bacterium]|nr:hypothetical protein [Candidatus Omnitrophota bacterium]